jgi:Raf kinase inhibitor-like YbhB/YbcL family protein
MTSGKRPGPEAGEGIARGSSGFAIGSTAFADGAMIPVPFTCDGVDRSPALAWRDPPGGTRAFALIVHDPDAPAGDWIHWLLYDIPGERRELPEAVPGRDVVEGVGTQGMNDFGRVGWGGPCPPRGSSHRYRFRLLALDRALGLEPRLRAPALLAAVKGHVLAETVLVGRYQRPSAR